MERFPFSVVTDHSSLIWLHSLNSPAGGPWNCRSMISRSGTVRPPAKWSQILCIRCHRQKPNLKESRYRCWVQMRRSGKWISGMKRRSTECKRNETSSLIGGFLRVSYFIIVCIPLKNRKVMQRTVVPKTDGWRH